MNVIQNLVPESKYGIKCPYAMVPEGVCVHNTANDASARNEVAYMIRNEEHTSFHYAVDDIEVVQGIPENRTAWHAGDNLGPGNMKHIGVEICYSLSGGDRFIQAERNAAVFIAWKLKEYGWGVERVKKHQDFADKYCPHRTLDMGWQRFLSMVQAELDRMDTGFVDVPADSWYASAVKWAVENGITNGIDDSRFGPDTVCTRAQAVTMLWRAMGKAEPEGGYIPFADVQPAAYYAKAVQWAVQKGVTSGVDASHFAPDSPCTRGQIVTFLWRSAGEPCADAPAPFEDVQPGAYYAGAVEWAYGAGIASGVDSSNFRPEDHCNRAQMVTFLHRMSKV